MSEQSGTLEVLVRELTRLLAPLSSLTPDTGHLLLRELGLPMTPAKAQAAGAALAKTSNALAKLIDLKLDLDVAIDADDGIEIGAKAVAALDQIGKLIAGFNELKAALGGLGLPNAGPILQKLPSALLDHLLTAYLAKSPFVLPALSLAGIVERTDHNVESLDPNEPFYTQNELHLGRIGGWMTDPGGQLEELYDWGKPGFDGTKVLEVVDRIVAEAGFPVLYEGGPEPSLDAVVAKIYPRKDVSPRGLEVRIDHGVRGGVLEYGGQYWTATVSLGTDVPADTKLLLQPGKVTLDPPGATKVSGEAGVRVAYRRPADDPLVLLSVGGGSRVTVEEVAAHLTLEAEPSGKAGIGLGAELKGGKVRISAAESDGFISTILGALDIENDFDLGLSFSTAEGLHFHGSSALEIQLASHVSLGPIELTALTLSVGIDAAEFPVGITTDIKASLGPLVAIVEGIGFELVFELVDGNSGNLGPLDLGARFVPPRGIGLSLDVGVVKGGGYLFFDFDREEYGGALQLDIVNLVSAKAIGIVTTRMPDGSKGFSLLIIISAEFSPAFQLGYGFTLNGVGGLLGLNRTVNLEVLREGVRTGAVNSIMFPQNVVENAPQIISDLRSVFPPEEGVFLIGPMAKLGWGTPTLVSLSFGLIVEIPGNIAILGVLLLALPDEDLALVKIQVNFVGTLDFDKGMLTFDASLYDSYVLILTLEGDMAVRFKWSKPAGFLISIGGFHPSYQPPKELEVPKMKRLRISILDTEWARIRVEVYFAFTSNSVQLGARAELYLGFDAFYVDGYLGFDALFRFSPFYFEISIKAGLTLHVFGADVVSIKVSFSLSGPTPWRAWGTGSVTILLWEIEADFDFTWGDKKETALPDVQVLPLLLEDLDRTARWQALPPPSTSLWVALRALDETQDALVLHPAGRLAVTQSIAPLGMKWDKLGHQKPADIRRATFESAASGSLPLTLEPIEDQFARSHFQALSDAKKLSVPSFEPMQSGATLRLGAELACGPHVKRTIEYEIAVIDKKPPMPRRFVAIRGLHSTFLAGNAVALASSSAAKKKLLDPHPEKIVAHGEGYVVAATKNNQPHGVAKRFTSEAMAKEHLEALEASDPALRGTLHVLPEFEVAA